jgi:serine/threonine-protein kinase RsbW
MCGSRATDKKRGDSRETLHRYLPEVQRGRFFISSTAQVPELQAEVVRVMERAGYGERDTFAVRLALEEAVVNAVKHGHRHNPGKQACVWWAVTTTAVQLVVEDEGPGFDPGQVPDPRPDENHERPSGRGLLLIHAYMTWVNFNRRGNCIAMCRHRSQGAA